MSKKSRFIEPYSDVYYAIHQVFIALAILMYITLVREQ